MAITAFYPLSGNANDLSGNGKNGTESNISYVPGISGQMARFNGSSSKLSFANGYAPILPTGSAKRTYSILFRLGSSPNYYNTIWHVGNYGYRRWWWILLFPSQNLIYVYTYSQDGNNYAAQSAPFTPDTLLHHLVVVLPDGGPRVSDIRIYLDSKRLTTTPVIMGADGNLDTQYNYSNTAIGWNQAWNGHWFKGDLSQMKVDNVDWQDAGVKNQYAYYKGFF